MADWKGVAASNRFHVKDVEAFREAVEVAGVEVFDERDGAVSMISKTEDGAWPLEVHDADTDEWQEFDFLGIIQEHIAEGSCAILWEVGNANHRLLTGTAQAISAHGIRFMSLDQIHQMADEMMKGIE